MQLNRSNEENAEVAVIQVYMTEKDVRYDRQLRLWGDEGQFCIERANICILGSSALASEIVKNLVLAGIRYVYIVDDASITEPDLGNNFFLESSDLGQTRAKVTLRYLKELNPMVKGDFDARSVQDFLSNDITSLSKFCVVIGANLIEKTALEVSKYLFERNIPFVNAKILGFAGYVRVCIKEHTIDNTHLENEPVDLRLDRPFPALTALVEAVDLDCMPYETHSHTPYLLLYFKALEIWKKRYGNGDTMAFPDVYEKRKEFEKIFCDLRMPHPETGSLVEDNFMEGKAAIVRCLRRTTIPKEVQELLKNEKAEKPDLNPFWIFVSALKRFIMEHDVLPVSGKIPDMISDSVRYTSLAKIYRKKALEDAAEVYSYVLSILSDLKLPKDYLQLSECQSFCKNAAFLRVQHGTSIEQEVQSHLENVFAAMREVEVKPNSITSRLVVPPCIWYLLMRAVDRFYAEKWRYPGCNGVPCTIDSHDLKLRVASLIQDSEVVDGGDLLSKVPKEAIDEICRYGNSELHVIASLIGGITAQEVIKLATHQYIPLQNCFVFDGHTQQGATFQL